MSDVKVIKHLLHTNATLTAQVPTSRIKSGILNQGIALPAIGIASVSTMRRNPVKTPTKEFCTSRVQVTVLAKNYEQQKSLLNLVRDAVPRSQGSIASVDVDSILFELEGPDFSDDAVGIYMQSIDFIVKYRE